MAVIYLRSSDGSDASDGLTWANAKATLAAALTAAGAGGTVYVADGHAETQASAMSLTSPGTAASPVTVLCVDDTGDPEPPTALAITATVSTTGNSAIAFAGFAYVYGVTFQTGSSSNNAALNFTSVSPWWWRLDSCALRVRNTGNDVSAAISVGQVASNGDDQLLELVNTVVSFAHASGSFRVRTMVSWAGGSLEGTAPTQLFSGSGNGGVTGLLRASGVDFSVATGILVLATPAQAGLLTFENCKLGTGVTIASGAVAGQGGFEVVVVNCDSADTNYRYCKKTYQGEITQETTIVRDSGASDGTTAISRKMVTTANSKFYSPLVSDPIAVWLETLSSTTVTVEVVTDGVTLTDAEAWIEVEYLGTSGFPISSIASDSAANILATPANQTSSSETWTTTGLTTPVKQKLAVTFTPAEKGPAMIRVHLAKASTTMYFCPKADVS